MQKTENCIFQEVAMASVKAAGIQLLGRSRRKPLMLPPRPNLLLPSPPPKRLLQSLRNLRKRREKVGKQRPSSSYQPQVKRRLL
ncbi:hypothetical protein CXB51_032501 [Gossypium anomalum]|uniref:Uncharacterized protein n=1 Tax=Gossypium anomalum TaxID=47600 RepID=A0A8J5XUV9_9ROSI|nr:hypothetical protein CXB51_032501 [Gossypium anomalum]